MAENSVNVSISQAEQRPFKPPQLPALRAVVSEPAQQKRRFFLLLFLSSSGSLPETWKSAHRSVPHRCGESLVLSCHLRRKANAGVRCLVLSPHSPDKGRRQGFAGHGCSPPPSPDTAAHRGKQGRNWHLLLWAVVSLIKSDIQEAISMGRCSLLIVLLEDLISVVYTLLKIR